MKPHMARLTLARKIAAITLIVWKKGATLHCLTRSVRRTGGYVQTR
jgi:hypothetical protein